MREVEKTSLFMIECAARAGADMMFFGSVGTELFNPSIIEEHNLRPARLYAERCKELGLFSLMHSCGRTRIFLERGWFRGFAPTIFESFTSAPLGDIERPREAVDQLHPETFFKGGLSLELVRNGTPEQVREAVGRAYENFGHRKFILAGTCAILTGTPRENLEAITDAALEFE
jgi:uroporphyrinogen-III decarboxylase